MSRDQKPPSLCGTAPPRPAEPRCGRWAPIGWSLGGPPDGLDSVIETVGGPLLVEAFGALAGGGVLVPVGHVSDDPEAFPRVRDRRTLTLQTTRRRL